MSITETRTFFFLEEAFELLGKHLYSSEWTGRELTAWPVDDPDVIERKRTKLDKRIEDLRAEIAATEERIATTVDATRIDELRERRAAQLNEHGSLHSTLALLPVIDDTYRNRHRTHQRRLNAEAILVDALSAGDLQALATRGLENTGIPKHFWQGEKGFKYYLELSLVVLPRQDFGKRRATVKFGRTDTHTWLKTVAPIAEGARAVRSLEEQATVWFVEYVERYKTKRPTKANVFDEMRERFPGLSKRACERIWNQHAPEKWKRAGRMPST